MRELLCIAAVMFASAFVNDDGGPLGDHVEDVTVIENTPIIVKTMVPPNTETTKSIVKYRSNSKDFFWRVYPNEVACWAKPGEYSFEAFVITVTVDGKKFDLTSEDHTYRIIVQPSTPVPPGPGPGPNPPGPSTAFKTAVLNAYNALPEVARKAIVEFEQGDGHKTQKAARLIIADTYAQIAQAASVPNVYDVATMLNEAKTRHASTLPVSTLTAWRPFFTALATALVAEKLAADDVPGHVKRFQEIAEVLNQAT